MRWYKKSSQEQIDQIVGLLRRMSPEDQQALIQALQEESESSVPQQVRREDPPAYDIEGGPETSYWYNVMDPKGKYRIPKKYAPPWETPEQQKAREREEMYMRAGWGDPPEDTIEDIQRRQRLQRERKDRPIDPSQPVLAFGPPLTDTNSPMMRYSPDIVEKALEDGGDEFPVPSPWPRPGKPKPKSKRRTPKRRPGPNLEEGAKRPHDGTGWPRPSGTGA